MLGNSTAFSSFAVPDLDGARTFYREVLGLAVTDLADAGLLQLDIAGGRYKTFTYDATFGNRGLKATPFDGPSARLVSPAVRRQFAAMLKRLGSLQIKLPRSKAHPGFR